jgi:hypothetical protein
MEPPERACAAADHPVVSGRGEGAEYKELVAGLPESTDLQTVRIYAPHTG